MTAIACYRWCSIEAICELNIIWNSFPTASPSESSTGSKTTVSKRYLSLQSIVWAMDQTLQQSFEVKSTNCCVIDGSCTRRDQSSAFVRLTTSRLSSSWRCQSNCRIVRFQTLQEIETFPPPRVTYYRPFSEALRSMGGFMVHPLSWACYGFQMTLSQASGIMSKPMADFLEWLGHDFAVSLCYLVQSTLESQSHKQSMETQAASGASRERTSFDNERPDETFLMRQCADLLDPFTHEQ